MRDPLATFYQGLQKKKLAPIYLIASDVSLLKQEARDALRKAARSGGFQERQTEFVEAGFDWTNFFANQQNLSLFSDKVYIELHHPSAKFDDKAVKALKSYLENPAEDKLLVILSDKLTTAQQKARWL